MGSEDPSLTCVLTLGDIINGRHASQEEDIADLDLVLKLLNPLVRSKCAFTDMPIMSERDLAAPESRVDPQTPSL